MSESPYIARVTIRQMLVAVLLVCVSLGLTRGVLVLALSYKITPFESLDGVLAWVGIVGAGTVLGLAVSQFVGAPKRCAIAGACLWSLLILYFAPLFFEALRLDRSPLSPEARQTRMFVYYLASQGQLLAAGDTLAIKQGINEFLQRLKDEGLLDASDTSYHGAERGRDGWGRKLIVRVDNTILLVRSKGRDGIDEKGGGDDIEAFVDCHDLFATVRVVPGLPERRKLFDW